mmetsp:Transcript_113072/g.320295  ORF Transcript_113072/g.320295 Transcript_113072/m.320295 type:complete len:202 (-) Transcript_113072:142-747(-)
MARAANPETQDRLGGQVRFLHRAGLQEHAHQAAGAEHVLLQVWARQDPDRVQVRRDPRAPPRLVHEVRERPQDPAPHGGHLAGLDHAGGDPQADGPGHARLPRGRLQSLEPLRRPALRPVRCQIGVGPGRHGVHHVHPLRVLQEGQVRVHTQDGAEEEPLGFLDLEGRPEQPPSGERRQLEDAERHRQRGAAATLHVRRAA